MRSGWWQDVFAPRRAAGAAACLVFLCVAGGEAFGQEAPDRQTGTRPVERPAEKRAERPGQKPAERPTENPSWLLNRANHFVMQDRCGEAIPLLETLVTKFPEVIAAREMLADCYLKAGRAQDAATLLERCLEENPENFAYARLLGLAYLDLGQKEKTLSVWHSFLKDDERSASLYLLVAKLEQEAGLYEEAVKTLRAGKRFKPQEESYARELVRLERILGQDEEAFREALSLVGRREGALELELRVVTDIFRESENKDRLVAIVDSVAAARGAEPVAPPRNENVTAATGAGKSDVFRTLKTLFLVETGRYDDVRAILLGTGAPPLREEELYSLLNHMEQRVERERDERFLSLYHDAMRQFLERYGSSMFAPRVMLMMASSKRNEARGAGPRGGGALGSARVARLEEALTLADDASRHRAGATYVGKAAVFKAQVLFEDLGKPEEALKELERIRGMREVRTAEASALLVHVLLALGDREETMKDLKRLAGEADSSRSVLGTYGIGKFHFLMGKYGEAVKVLSDLAERHPSSAWANDALELAMDIKKAMPEGTAALSLYSSAVRASDRGGYAQAIDSLAALEEGHPASSLVPRAIFMKATIEVAAAGASAARGGVPAALGDDARVSMLDAARSDFIRLAERYPLHDLAPRALEELAALAEAADAHESLRQYAELMKRYPDYPFMERVRERYVALGKSASPVTPPTGEAPSAKEPSPRVHHKKGDK